jgi:hypothetical protein
MFHEEQYLEEGVITKKDKKIFIFILTNNLLHNLRDPAIWEFHYENEYHVQVHNHEDVK